VSDLVNSPRLAVNQIGADGAEAIAEAVKTNKTLQQLNLQESMNTPNLTSNEYEKTKSETSVPQS